MRTLRYAMQFQGWFREVDPLASWVNKKTSLTKEDAGALARLAQNPDYQVLVRLLDNRLHNLMVKTVRLPTNNPQTLAVMKARYDGQREAIILLKKDIAEAYEKLESEVT